MKFFGSYKAKVTNNHDPEFRQRIKVTCPILLGEDEETDWILPIIHFGFFNPPEENDIVSIECEQGDPDILYYRGKWNLLKNGFTDAPSEAIYKELGQTGNWDIPSLSTVKRLSPTNRIFKTKSGLMIEYDEEIGQEKIKITDSKGQFILIRSANGREKIFIKDKAGNKIELNSISGSRGIKIYDYNNNKLVLDSEGNNGLLQVSNNITIKAGGSIYLE